VRASIITDRPAVLYIMPVFCFRRIQQTDDRTARIDFLVVLEKLQIIDPRAAQIN